MEQQHLSCDNCGWVLTALGTMPTHFDTIYYWWVCDACFTEWYVREESGLVIDVGDWYHHPMDAEIEAGAPEREMF